jgi:hypothetical protein
MANTFDISLNPLRPHISFQTCINFNIIITRFVSDQCVDLEYMGSRTLR